MKKRWMIALLAALTAGLLFCAAPALGEAADGELDEWTVLFYFCGSDLESKYSYASGNLAEIGAVRFPDSFLSLFEKKGGGRFDAEEASGIPKVNVLIETGGAKQWHSQDMDIASDALQRWRYECVSVFEDDPDVAGYQLMQTLPLANMADPQTLADFIRWGVQTCPAKKYALVLWDHGGGAKTGLIIDELFDGDVLYLYELRQALSDAGTQFEAVIIDACMMANIETAWAIKDNARWMVASEEVVPGKGAAMGDWLQELYNHPECDGEQLGRTVCDMTQIKYANVDDEQARLILTWSVIDLTRIDRLAEVAGQFFQEMGRIYRDCPELAITYASYIRNAEEYGDGSQDMRDIGGIFYSPSSINFLDRRMRGEMQDALSDAVVYAVRGSGRSGARGLSFCYPVASSPEELEHYAKNCPSPYYLAYLDAVSGWSAPDWVYERAERLPEIDTIEALQMEVTRCVGEGGLPCVTVKNLLNNLDEACYRLYRVDEATGQTLLLGRVVCDVNSVNDDGSVLFGPKRDMTWPAIDGVLCDLELVTTRLLPDDMGYEYLCNIPVHMGADTCFLRCGYSEEYTDGDALSPKMNYEVYGVWAGYDESTQMTNRSVRDLANLAGQEFQMLYPTDAVGEDGRRMYQSSDEALTMYRALDVEEVPLPAGTYYIEYEIDDMFDRPFVMERIEMHWDGETLTIPNADAWTGETLLLENQKR